MNTAEMTKLELIGYVEELRDRIRNQEANVRFLIEDRRFTAAVAAMQGLLPLVATREIDYGYEEMVADSVEAADALLAELDRTAKGGTDGEG